MPKKSAPSNLPALGLSITLKAPPLDSIKPKPAKTKREREMEEETERQKTLPKGWHAVKDLCERFPKGGKGEMLEPTGTYWRYYVAYFTKTGADNEDSLLVVDNYGDAERIAHTLNTNNAKPAWL